jgi:hypothetical protein
MGRILKGGSVKKADIELGAVYIAKVSGKLARVRIDDYIRDRGWIATNLDTRREVFIKSAQRLRKRVEKTDASHV